MTTTKTQFVEALLAFEMATLQWKQELARTNASRFHAPLQTHLRAKTSELYDIIFSYGFTPEDGERAIKMLQDFLESVNELG